MDIDPSAVLTMTVREFVKEQRAAFVAGSQAENAAWMRTMRVNHTSGFDSIAASRDTYPLPKITRPRVVVDPHDGELRWTVRGGDPRLYDRDRIPCCPPTKERVALWASLLEHPNEEVEDDA